MGCACSTGVSKTGKSGAPPSQPDPSLPKPGGRLDPGAGSSTGPYARRKPRGLSSLLLDCKTTDTESGRPNLEASTSPCIEITAGSGTAKVHFPLCAACPFRASIEPAALDTYQSEQRTAWTGRLTDAEMMIGACAANAAAVPVDLAIITATVAGKKVLGEGACGHVRQARIGQVETAIKSMPGPTGPQDLKVMRSNVDAFSAEAHTLSVLSQPGICSDNIVQPLGYIAHILPAATRKNVSNRSLRQVLWEQGPYRPAVTHLALELCEGGSLDEHIYGRFRMKDEARTDPHAYAAYLHLAQGTAAGLAQMHDANIVHLDLKPANILLDSLAPSKADHTPFVKYSEWRPTPKLADLGFSCTIDPTTGCANIEEGRYRGSPAYVAPEMARRYFKAYMGSSTSSISHKADIYAYGISMLELWQGHLPWNDLPVHTNHMITIPEHVPPEMDAEWPPDCLRLLQLAAELGTEIPQPGANLCWDILQRQTKRQPPVIKEMVRRCCHPNPAMRPSAVQLHAALSKELARAEQPLQAEEAKNEARHQIWLRLEANKQVISQNFCLEQCMAQKLHKTWYI
ncbi:hypothetical protein WJX74_002515 [Apatococcus lobatus]|uniref:Protein kinase domain-containing protein n=1 Tax=Apatococcus lobatus TaxID=904363 RepID=A0AAW1REV8_9CHLO